MNLSNFDNALWAASLVGHVALVLILVWRGKWREFPVFTSFVGFAALTTVLLFLVLRYGSKHGYFLAYWITGFADYLFQVALIFEIARDVLRPTGTWVQDARKSFLGWGGVGLLWAAALASQIGPPQARGFDLWDVRVTVFTSVLTCSLVTAMSVAANRLGLQERSPVVAIGHGIGVWAFIALLEEFGHVVFGWDRQFVVFVHIREIVYLTVLVYWMMTFWLPEKVRAPLSPEMTAYLVALHQRVQYSLQSNDRRTS